MDDRKTLISSGEHIAAVRRLGESYTDAEYIEAVEAARAGGAGELYADAVLGVDVDDLLRGVEEKEEPAGTSGEFLLGLDTQRRADAILRRRGVRPDRASQAEMLDALLEVSS